MQENVKKICVFGIFFVPLQPQRFLNEVEPQKQTDYEENYRFMGLDALHDRSEGDDGYRHG